MLARRLSGVFLNRVKGSCFLQVISEGADKWESKLQMDV